MTPDTNLLVRLIVQDDPEQTNKARVALGAASVVALTLPALCEMCWVLKSYYRLSPAQIHAAVAALTDAPNVLLDRNAIDIGLALLASGGDFADGAIAASGEAMGVDTFVSFDGRAVRLLAKAGQAARLLA